MALAPGDVAIFGSTQDGSIWHTVRHGDGTYDQAGPGGKGDLTIEAGNSPGNFGSVGCAYVNGQLQVCGTTGDGGLYHTVQYPDGTWQPFGDVLGQVGARPPHNLSNSSCCAHPDGTELAICATTGDSEWIIMARKADGTWYPWNDWGVTDNDYTSCAVASETRGVRKGYLSCATSDDGKVWGLDTDSNGWQVIGDGGFNSVACLPGPPYTVYVTNGNGEISSTTFEGLPMNPLPAFQQINPFGPPPPQGFVAVACSLAGQFDPNHPGDSQPVCGATGDGHLYYHHTIDNSFEDVAQKMGARGVANFNHCDCAAA